MWTSSEYVFLDHHLSLSLALVGVPHLLAAVLWVLLSIQNMLSNTWILFGLTIDCRLWWVPFVCLVCTSAVGRYSFVVGMCAIFILNIYWGPWYFALAFSFSIFALLFVFDVMPQYFLWLWIFWWCLFHPFHWLLLRHYQIVMFLCLECFP